MVIVSPESEQARGLWKMVIALSRLQPTGWTLIGAQMVALHGLEQGRISPRKSFDVDVLVNPRVLQGGTERLSRVLMDAGFEFQGANVEGVGHRFRRGRVAVDILAPDGLGPRARLSTVPSAHTVSVPGGSQALSRTEAVEVNVGGETALVPRPSLLGAILLKARAVEVDDVPESQRRDLAFLLTLVSDPRALAIELKGTEQGWLRRRAELLDPQSPVWQGLDGAEDGRLALRILADM